MNPLLQTFDTPFHTVPFPRIKNEHFLPALDQELHAARQRIKHIRENTETPDFANTIEALEYAGEPVERIARIFFNLNHAETNSKMQELAKTIAPKLTEFGNDITLDSQLFERIKTVFSKTACGRPPSTCRSCS